MVHVEVTRLSRVSEVPMTRLDWALLLLTPLGWILLSAVYGTTARLNLSVSDDASHALVGGAFLTLACWGVYLGWGRP